ncbi:MAG: hypothetical protein EA392_06335 [Cryomorphaceae bacterium]|nr:MAG: hypothetical protein EA392_06335 [Cryomorphaceae bacterium]
MKYGLLHIFLMTLVLPLSAQSPKKVLKAADKFYQTRQYEDAYHQYAQAAEIDPRSEDAHMGMGNSLREMGRLAEAYGDFQRAVAINPKLWEARHMLGTIDMERGEYAKALNHLQRAHELNKKDLVVMQELLQAQIKSDHLDKAEELSQKLLKRKKSAVNQYLRGVVLDSLKRHNEAESFYNQARFSDPKLTEAHLGAAHARLRQGKLREALEDCNRALEQPKKLTRTYWIRSEVKTELRDFHGAINDLSALIEAEPENIGAIRQRASVYEKTGQFENAIPDWTTIIEGDKTDHQALFRRAAAFERLHRFELAVQDYRELLRRAPYDEQAQTLLASAESQLYQLKKEDKPPQIQVTSHKVNQLNEIEIPAGERVVTLSGDISDDSPIDRLLINGQAAAIPRDSINPHFSFDWTPGDAKELELEAVDIYNNVSQVLYRVKRTETDAPRIRLLSPYAGDDGEVRIAGNIYDINVEGQIFDESRITSIVVNNVNASFNTSQHNPRFSAKVRIANMEYLTVNAEDEYGNKAAKKLRIRRDGLTISEDNPMGNTWVVFIENSEYQSFASIDGPARDVNLMKQAFAGYSIHNTIHRKNLTKDEMDRFFSIELRDLVRSNNVNSLLIWYAGHGKYINETGYWIPVDARRDDEFSYFNINLLKAGLQGYAKDLSHTLVITDACESGPSFAEVTRDHMIIRRCDDWEATHMRSSQVFSSAGYELASDNSQFTQTFANLLSNHPDDCLPIEAVVRKVTEVVLGQGTQTPKFGILSGMGHEDGTFFFIRKKR